MPNTPYKFRSSNSAKRVQLVSSLAAALLVMGLYSPVFAQSLVERYAELDASAGLSARGIIVPNAEVTFSSILAAPIDELPFKGGASFKKGDRLVSFDCGRNEAELRGAEAALGKQRLILENREKLMQRNAAGAFEVAEARADFQAARANKDVIEETLKFCDIDAPFDGRVLDLQVDLYELPSSTAPLMTVIDESSLELDLIVPSKWLQWISVGEKFDFNVEETGEFHPAQIVRLGAKVDAVSQTIKITGKFIKRPANVLSGMSGSARFNPPSQ